jgi:hypothetical protein
MLTEVAVGRILTIESWELLPLPVTESLSMKYDRHQFEGSTEVLDANEYQMCEFRNCTLIYKGGKLPELVHCRFENVRWQFGDAAGRTLDLLGAIYRGGGGGPVDIQRIFEEVKREH